MHGKIILAKRKAENSDTVSFREIDLPYQVIFEFCFQFKYLIIQFLTDINPNNWLLR